MIPTKEQIQWFWEQFGFEYDDDWLDKQPYKDPQGTILHNWKGEDLNNLFKYAVHQVPHNNWKFVLHTWVNNSVGDYEKDALALFWAIFQCLERK